MMDICTEDLHQRRTLRVKVTFKYCIRKRIDWKRLGESLLSGTALASESVLHSEISFAAAG